MPSAEIHTTETAVLPRRLDIDYRSIERGDGVWLHDSDGKTIIDASSGGAMTACLGFGRDSLVDAAADQSARVPYVYESFFSNEPRERLATRLIELVAPEMSWVRFCTGGSEANEMALRLARSYHVERGDPDRWRIISPTQAYHGATLGTLAMTGRPSMREHFDSYLPRHSHLSPLAHRKDTTGEAALEELDRAIEEAGADSIAAYFCEPISGAALPAFSPSDPFWQGLDERRREYGFLVCFDEVVTGLGRTGTWLAAHQLPIDPDIVVIGKGLGAGYAPLTAVLCTDEVHAPITGGSKQFAAGHTWDGAPLPCAVGLAVLDELEKEDLVGQVQARGPGLLKRLMAEVGDLDLVGEVRGRGFLLGVELVHPNNPSGIIPPEFDAAIKLEQSALERGLLISASHASADGLVGDQVVFAPAFVATDADLDEMVTRLGEVLNDFQDRVLREPDSGSGS